MFFLFFKSNQEYYISDFMWHVGNSFFANILIIEDAGLVKMLNMSSKEH